MIYTFYSYKGGVGRSMAVANIAQWLMSRGARVIMIDWDLEAPGLEQFFYQSQKDLDSIRAKPGLIDMLVKYRRLFDKTMRANPDFEQAEAFKHVKAQLPSLSEYLHPIHSPNTEEKSGALWLLLAGKRTSENLSEYADAVQDFDWPEFYRAFNGEEYFEWLRTQLISDHFGDVVLVDSRTGISEMGGICTRHLADVVVCFCAPNLQNLQGTILMSKSFRRPEILDARGGKPEIVFVPTRIDSAEIDSRNRFKELFQKEEQEFLPAVFRTLQRSFWDLQIPYVARFSYSEALAVPGPSTAKVVEAEEMANAYRRIAAHLVLLAASDSPLRIQNSEELEQFVSTGPFKSSPEKLWRSVFISYARSDGVGAAELIRERLSREAPDITVWHDRSALVGGLDWMEQLKNAISSVETLVFVMTPASLESEATQREWRYARQQGLRVFPVAGVPLSDSDFSKMPGWMRKIHFFDMQRDWIPFLQQLRTPHLRIRVPLMAPSVPAEFVKRPIIQEELESALLTSDDSSSVIALVGAGGSGKSTMAAAICTDEQIVNRFSDGILWTTLGPNPDLVGNLTALYSELTGDKPSFPNIENAYYSLAQKLEDRECLLVLDDAWDSAHLLPFLRGGRKCLRLVTTRRQDLATAVGAKHIMVEAMLPEEAASLVPDPELASRLGLWPLALTIAASLISQRVRRGEEFPSALQYVKDALVKKGLPALPGLIESLQPMLHSLIQKDRNRLMMLSTKSNPISIDTAVQLWGVDQFDAENTIRRLEDLSLVRYDLSAREIHVHGIVRQFRLDEFNSAGLEKPGMHVRELSEGDRHRLLMHFLALDASARLLRFGMVFPDELITTYVQQMNFARDTLFGVYDSELMLAGVGHLAFTPREALPVVARATSKERVAEFGVSVFASARGMGIGTSLFERAAIHCRNADVDTLLMHFLSSSQSMMHIARKAGMEVHHDRGEADAYLKLPPADAASASREVVEEQVASLDYTLKLEARLRSLIAAETRYRALLETTPAITYMADLTDEVKMHYVSPHTESLLGFSAQEWLTDPERWVKQLDPIDRDRVLDAFNDTFISGIPFKMEYRLVTRDGASRWFQDHGVVITDEIQKRSYMYGTMVDITDRKAAEA